MHNIYFRHSKIREHQAQMINDVYSALEHGNHLLAHAPCGIGKTDGVLSPAFTYALENDLDVFFITPKISQHKIAAEVIKGISEKYGLEIRAIDLIGRRHSCIHPILSELDHDSFYQSCEKLRKEEKCPYYSNARGNTKLEEAKAEILFSRILAKYGAVKTHDELIAECEDVEACPYEIMLKISSHSRFVIADYFHLVAPQIRSLFLSKSKKKLENSIVIIDEAHNLPKRVRDYLSVSFNNRFVSKMEKEAHSLGFKLRFENEFNSWAKESLGEEKEAVISMEKLNSLLAYFNMRPDEIIDYFESLGIAFIEKTSKKSALLKFSNFLKGWYEDSLASVRIVRRNETFFSVSKRLMDPGVITSELNKVHSAILMSATLYPLHMYRDVLGLDEKRTMMKSYPSPFPKYNRLNLIVEETTTRYSHRTAEEYRKIACIIDEVHKTKGKTAAFFPSYKVLNSVLPFIKSRPLFIQEERMKSLDIHRLAKNFSSLGGILIAVQGGSLSEGVDFNNGEIKNVIVVGIALEEMNLEIKFLINYYQEKFGKGWEYAYLYPAVMRALQSAGRAIRKEDDKAAIIFLDERFNWSNYRKMLPKEERFTIISSQDLQKYLQNFWVLDSYNCL